MGNRKIFPAIIFIICATVAVLYWQLIYIPVQNEISRLNAETKRMQTIISELEYFQRRYKNPEEVVEFAIEKLRIAQELLPAEMNVEEFIADLYSNAANKKILINSIQVGENSETDSVQRQPLKIKLDADYISLLNFIREIIDGRRLANLEGFSISRNGDSNILECELDLIIFAVVAE